MAATSTKPPAVLSANGNVGAPLDNSPLPLLERLCDPGTFRPLRSGAVSVRLGDRATPGDGVLGGAGEVNGRPVFCYSQDPKYLGGSLGEVHADTIVRLMRMAGDAGAPVVGFVRSGGARLQEGHAALAGYGRIFRASVELSRKVPQISVVSGVSAGGGAYSPALTDYVVMTEEARMFLTGPKVVLEAMGEDISMEDLGGPKLHGKNGVCHLVAADAAAAIDSTRHLLGLLPQSISRPPEIVAAVEADGTDPGLTVPDNQRKVYDVRDVASAILDQGSFLELSPRWAPNMVTGIGRLEGRSVGLIANQPRAMGGVIDAAASEKGALFVADCDRFGLPLLVFVDTPGFMPGKRQEELGVIRHGASLLRAFAGASVPKVTLVLRKAFGGAAITMNSKDLGADVVYCWPGAQIGVMAARQAVGIVHHRALKQEHGPSHDELADAYAAEHLTAPAAAASGWVDEVIEPAVSRDRLAWALRSMGGPMSISEPTAGAPALGGSVGRGGIIGTYVALGDSFTAGRESIPGKRWADRLAGWLRGANPDLAYANLAVDGATSADVLGQLPAALEMGPDLVTVICGANDVLLTSRPDVGGYEERFSEILERLRDGAPGAAILTTTAPDSWHFMELRPRTKARLVKALHDLNGVTRMVAARHHVPCLNVAGHPSLMDPSNFSADGLHPSDVGHERSAQEIALSLRAHFGIQGDFGDEAG